MSGLAFVFPGQGARDVLAAAEQAAATPLGASLLQRAVTAAGLDLPALRAQAGRALERTGVLQPVLVAVSLATRARLKAAGVTPSLCLGHSLGELSAWAAAGAFTAEQAVDLAAARGAAMEQAAKATPGGLLALPSLEAAQRALVAVEGLDLAAVNAPDEVVVSGPDEALTLAARIFPGRRVPVSGPWHGRAMAPAQEGFRRAIAAVSPRPLEVPVVRSADGRLADGDARALVEALTRPVQFTAGLETARARGVDTFVTVGPGHVLRGLLRKNLGAAVRVLTTEDEADLGRTLGALLKERT